MCAAKCLIWLAAFFEWRAKPVGNPVVYLSYSFISGFLALARSAGFSDFGDD
jgi:hypothetical protein